VSQDISAGLSRRDSSGGGIGRMGPFEVKGTWPLRCELEPLEFVRAMGAER
jgi:hypothetical protein